MPPGRAPTAKKRRAAGTEGDGGEESPGRRVAQAIVPRSMAGLATVVFFMGIAAALTGVVLFAYYENRLDETERSVSDFVGGFEESLESAQQIIDTQSDEAQAEIEALLNELEQFSATGETLSQLVEEVEPSVFFVQTLGVAGEPSVGSAFVVFSDADQSYLLTSFSVVAASTAEPGPEITLVKGDEQLAAELITWEESRDLALLAVDQAGLDRLEWAPTDPGPRTGDRVLAVTGRGGDGAGVVQGSVADVSGTGVQHDAAIGAAYRGWPLLNTDGQVLGVASRQYSPGFDPLAAFFAVPVRDACIAVHSCPEGAAATEPGDP